MLFTGDVTTKLYQTNMTPEAVDAIYHAAMSVLPEPTGAVREEQAEPCANLVAPELIRMGYHLVGPRPVPRRQKDGLKLEVG